MNAAELRALVFVCLLIFSPLIAAAKDMEADNQCPQGGEVGQKCSDTTNGYTTQGHCNYVNVCHADSWPKGSPIPQRCQNPNATSSCMSGVPFPPTGSALVPVPTNLDVANDPTLFFVSGTIDAAYSSSSVDASTTTSKRPSNDAYQTILQMSTGQQGNTHISPTTDLPPVHITPWLSEYVSLSAQPPENPNGNQPQSSSTSSINPEYSPNQQFEQGNNVAPTSFFQSRAWSIGSIVVLLIIAGLLLLQALRFATDYGREDGGNIRPF